MTENLNVCALMLEGTQTGSGFPDVKKKRESECLVSQRFGCLEMMKQKKGREGGTQL